MQNLYPITVIKASGTREPFDEEKVINSLSRSGLSFDTASQTVDYLKRHLKKDTSTSTIYGHVSSFLKENAPVENFYSYSLKRAVMEMGPSGFPFEVLVSDLLKTKNYKTEVGVVSQGKCVTHEIDVVAQREKEKFFIECKFHNSAGYKTDVQVALYTYARFLDVSNNQKQTDPSLDYSSWLITNTKVTSEVYDYCKCVGQKVTSWTQPKGESLQELIESSNLHPITLLFQLPKNKTRLLLDKDIVTCSRLKTAILNNEVNDILDHNEKNQALKQISNICKNNG